MSQLADLAVPFPRNLIERVQGKYGDYVNHAVVNERLLLHLGAFSFEFVKEFRGSDGTLEAAVWRLTATVDGTQVSIEEVGDAVGGGAWKHDGERLKDSASDALKRCAMRLGLGLHLWSGSGNYFLRDKLKEREASTANAVSVEPDAALPANGSGSGDTSPPASPEPSTPGEAPPAASGVERVRAGSAALPPAADPPTAVKQRAEKLAAAKKSPAPHDPSEPRERGE